jgi:hypothetical protein
VFPEVCLRKNIPVTNGRELITTVDKLCAEYLNGQLAKERGWIKEEENAIRKDRRKDLE